MTFHTDQEITDLTTRETLTAMVDMSQRMLSIVRERENITYKLGMKGFLIPIITFGMFSYPAATRTLWGELEAIVIR